MLNCVFKTFRPLVRCIYVRVTCVRVRTTYILICCCNYENRTITLRHAAEQSGAISAYRVANLLLSTLYNYESNDSAFDRVKLAVTTPNRVPPRTGRITRSTDLVESPSYRELCRQFHADENASSDVSVRPPSNRIASGWYTTLRYTIDQSDDT